MDTDEIRQIFPIGCRVELKPHLDDWMRGSRYGEVKGYLSGLIRVRLDTQYKYKHEFIRLFKKDEIKRVG